MANEIPDQLRDAALASVGAVLYVAASPDIADGLSNEEFKVLKEQGPAFFQLMELLDRGGVIPEGYRLPEGFSSHFEHDVIPDLEAVRKNPEARSLFRGEVAKILGSETKRHDLYREGGQTYSEELQQARIKSSRQSGFARNVSGRKV